MTESFEFAEGQEFSYPSPEFETAKDAIVLAGERLAETSAHVCREQSIIVGEDGEPYPLITTLIYGSPNTTENPVIVLHDFVAAVPPVPTNNEPDDVQNYWARFFMDTSVADMKGYTAIVSQDGEVMFNAADFAEWSDEEPIIHEVLYSENDPDFDRGYDEYSVEDALRAVQMFGDFIPQKPTP